MKGSAILVASLAIATALLVWAALEANEQAATTEKPARLRLGCWSFGSTGARIMLCRELS